MGNLGSNLKRVSNFTDCTDGLPEDLPYLRKTSEEEIYCFATTPRSRRTNQRDWSRKLGWSGTRLGRLIFGLLVSSILIFLAWYSTTYFSFDSWDLPSLYPNDNGEEATEPQQASSIALESPNTTLDAQPANQKENSRTPAVSISKAPIEVIAPLMRQESSPPESLTLPTLHLATPPTKETIVYKISKNDTWSIILQRHQLDNGLSAGIVKAIQDLSKVEKTISTRLKVGGQISIELSPTRAIETISLNLSGGKYILLEPASGDGFKANLKSLPHHFRQFVATGRITSSLAGDAAKVGVAYDIIDDFVDMFSDRVVFHQDLHPGDRFTILFEDEMLEDGTSLGKTEIIAASLLLQGERMAAIRFKGKDGKFRYFNEKGELLGDNFLRYPLKFSRISSLFSDNRMHPVLNVRMPHNGVDFIAPVGTPIRSVAQGSVVFSGWAGACGKMVKIQHNGRYSTAYCHLQSITDGVVKGLKIQRGQMIGALGATGRVTGAHLHYAFYDNNKFVDPLKMKLPTIDLLDAGSRIEKTYLSRAMQTIESYQQIESRSFNEDHIRLTYRDLDPSSNDEVFSIFNRYLNKIEPIILPR